MSKLPTDKPTASELALVAAALDPELAKAEPRRAVQMARKLISTAQKYIGEPGAFERWGRQLLASYEKDRVAKAKKLPEMVPFNKAIRFITDQKRTKLTLHNFTKALPRMYRYGGETPTPRMVNAQIERWRKTGIPRREVMELQAAYEKSWPRIIAGENRGKAKKRGTKLNPKDKPVIREVVRAEREAEE